MKSTQQEAIDSGQLKAINHELQLSQEKLSQANSNLEQILNMLPASVVVIRGYDLIVEMINESNLKYWNRTKEQVVGKPFLEILPDLADQPFAGQLRRVMETGEIIDVKESVVLFTDEDGSTRETYVDYTYQPLSDLDGNRNGVLVMSFEITDRVMSRRLLEKYAKELKSANAQLQSTNRELALSENRFKYLIEEAPVAIGILHGRELIIESANEKILEVWGKPRDIVGLPLHEALPELANQPFLDILDTVYTTGEPFSAQEISAMLEHRGELRQIFFNLTYQPVADSSGSTADILVVAVDVTKQVISRKQAEKSEQHFRYLADLVPAKISNILPNGEVTFLNKHWLDFAQMSFDDLKGFDYQQLMHPDEIAGFRQRLARAIEDGLPYTSEMRYRNTEGKYIWHLNRTAPIFDDEGKVAMLVGSATDIQSLKDEEERKSDFISTLSHELKTPVTSVKGHVQMLLRILEKEPPSPLSPTLQLSLNRVDKILVQQTKLISEMLDLTRIESGRLHLHQETVRIDKLVEEVVDDFKLSHPQHSFRLTSAGSAEVSADRHKISQVLINLIANAIKYSPESNIVDIAIRYSAKKIEIEIKDYGIGVDEKDHQKIFERFYRVEGQNEVRYNGFGIGLYLASSIMELHGGSISLKSSKGQGSAFTIHMPR
jgi:PAS domain S-box-containing protein